MYLPSIKTTTNADWLLPSSAMEGKPFEVQFYYYPAISQVTMFSYAEGTTERYEKEQEQRIGHMAMLGRVYPKTPFMCLLPFFEKSNWHSLTVEEALLVSDSLDGNMPEDAARIWIHNDMGLWIAELPTGQYFTVSFLDTVTGTFIECAAALHEFSI